MIMSQERVLKIDMVIWFSYHTKTFADKSFIETEGISQDLFMSEFQHQNSTK